MWQALQCPTQILSNSFDHFCAWEFSWPWGGPQQLLMMQEHGSQGFSLLPCCGQLDFHSRAPLQDRAESPMMGLGLKYTGYLTSSLFLC